MAQYQTGQYPQQGQPQQGQPPQGHPAQYHSQAPPQQGYPGQHPQHGQYQTGQYQTGGQYQSQQPQTWYSGYAQQCSPQELQQIQGWFQQVDKDRSGNIDARELHDALNLGGNNFQPDVIQRLIRAFDYDNSGNVGMNEFVAMHKFLSAMRDSFYYFDRDRSNSLDFNELHQALVRSGYQISYQSMMAILPKFDKDLSATLSFDQYLDMCVWLGNMRKLMMHYDVRRMGNITLNFDQLIAITPYYQ
eukprot:TRINITY_DN3093_c3_g1_i1.p1 TRINITY_DN3093_c3_g1~~TRINITY_DN3093_c3_g1_i1.p1  ORF type:complete len:256 (+),score=65.64 TRINITY_DN3093_c3_g1_i1:32-769(+)